MNRVILANITWNPLEWKNNRYINRKAGHRYAQDNVAGESLNFEFDKQAVDTDKHVNGFVQWKHAPVNFEEGGLVIFYTRNTDKNKGQIVGVYGKVEIFKEPRLLDVSFQKDEYVTNLKAEKDFSILFPLPLDADNYKENPSERMVGQIGFAYKDEAFAETILFDELTELLKAGTNEAAFSKISSIYEYYTGKRFKEDFVSKDEKEQNELVKIYQKNKSKEDIIKDLLSLEDNDSEVVSVNRKTYKRDNKTIAQIKILRDFKCQLCSTTILKKDGSKYIEAAHIQAKCLKGRETLDNIILLCPNHHKEFDLGNREVILHDTKHIEFLLNGQRYNIKLSAD